ncbi:ABC transporter ATP-binding protein [Microbacterium protaetiae]|uniref:ABC transporter ATP-binding protein n=1 Tax=Microbacterium protaetiae TaxID=2509458 RepID=UPI0013EC05EA|nr:ABC transporter ATP-binding protein [Microbacterium protaetiae]
MNAKVISLHNGSRTLPNGGPVLERVNLTVASRESVAIIGRSGSGKSTLLAGLGLLFPFGDGTDYRLLGHRVSTLKEKDAASLRARTVGFILQNSGLIEHLSALENVRLPLLHSRAHSPRAARVAAHEALERLGIEHLARRRPTEVSGGERQRIAIARALVIRPQLILADEPTGALDEQTGREVLDQLLALVEADASALVVVTHDAEIASRMQRTYRLHSRTLGPATNWVP